MAFSLPPPPNSQDITSQSWRDWFFRVVKAFQTAGSAVVNWGGITGTLADQTDLQAALDTKQAAIQFKDEGSNLGTSGTATSVDFVGAGVVATRVSNALTVTIAGTGSQAGIQFQDEGSNLGTSGTVDTVNFVGSTVTAARASNTVTVTVSASAGTYAEILIDDDQNIIFDDDGDIIYGDCQPC